MPAQRVAKRTAVAIAQVSALKAPKVVVEPVKPIAVDEDVSSKSLIAASSYIEAWEPHFASLSCSFSVVIMTAVHHYPTTAEERTNAMNRQTGRKVTPFQFQVYDLCAQVRRPCHAILLVIRHGENEQQRILTAH